ncbi:MAG: hypothetical protein HUU50_07555 [Candidatus Brocadiae bacterium]|nr:hypothetical protein [Candidatus Brocadiia bacterium]
MKNSILFSFLFIALLSFTFASDWEIDQIMRFQFAYVPDGNNPVLGENVESMKSLGLSNDYAPDIDNIPLSGIKGLGFTLPDRENNDQYKLYLKLFDFPSSWDAAKASSLVLEKFFLDKLSHGTKIAQFASHGKNLAIKFGVIDKASQSFSERNPYPSLLLEKSNPEFAKKFFQNVPFFSLYVTPGQEKSFDNDNEKAAYSASGVVAMHKQILAIYQKELEEFEGQEPEKYYYFRKAGKVCCSKPDKPSFVIKIQKNPFVFSNWKDLPMPSNPKKHFLSGLLLIYRSEIKGLSTLASETVFEVGSLIRLP